MTAKSLRISKSLAHDIYRQLFLTREMDDRAARYVRRGMGWSFHARCGGHEGIQIALGRTFRQGQDYLFPYYRDMGTALAAGISPYELFLNGLSKDADVASGGRHMSNHFAKAEIGIQNVSSCTGNHTLHAVGLGRAVKHYKKDAVVFCSQGDSSTSEGYCFEAFNGAAREELPVIFVIQNNKFGISVPIEVQSKNQQISDNYKGITGLKILHCDGTSVLDSLRVMDEAVAHVRGGSGPVMVHADCVRMAGHSNADAHELYRDKVDIEAHKEDDPLTIFQDVMLKKKWASKSDIQKLEADCMKILDADAEKAEAAPEPDPKSVEDFVNPKEAVIPYAKRSAGSADSTGPSGSEEKLREAINRTLKEEFRHNPNTFLWGQDVASKDKGGVFNLTKGLLQEFGEERVFNAPLCEDYIVGTANGMSRFDPKIRCVIEAAQFADYVWPAMEQIVELGHEYWRTKGQFCPNVVMRLASGGYIQGGLYHSQNVEAIMSHIPGIRVVYPSRSDDAAGLLRTAIRSEGPTFFLEPKYLYNRKEARGPNLGSDYAIPFGKARILREGSDLTIITYGNTAHMCLQVAVDLEKEDQSIEVIDLRSIKPFDKDAIRSSLIKTSRALVVHEDHMFNGIGSEISSFIMEECFEYLDAPVKRIAAKDIPVGFAKPIERATLPSVEGIKEAVVGLLGY